MRILVVTSDVPFVEGGHRIIARSLVRALRHAGNEAELLTTPQNRFGRQLSAYLATWLTDVAVAGDGRPVDGVVSLRFPGYAVRHPRHVVWLNHRMREYYDLWDEFHATLGIRGRLVEGGRRLCLRALDRWLLGRCSHVFAQSRTIRERLRRWGGIDADVLYPPPPQRDYHCEGYAGGVLSVGRLTRLKRVDLLLRAAAEAPGEWPVRIVGTGPEEDALRRLAAELGLDGRVEFLGQLSDEHLVGEYARCSAVYFGTRAEDYGLVTLEAFASAKPVVTCSDSGGPAELVRDGESGAVVPPEPAAVAAALEALASHPQRARQLGEGARRLAERHTWANAVTVLLDAAGLEV